MMVELGSLILWSTFGLFAASAIWFAVWVFQLRGDRRLLPTLSFIIASVTAVSYLSMAIAEGTHRDATDPRFTALGHITRFGEWAITHTLVLVELCVIAGLDIVSVMVVSFLNLIVVVCGLFGSLDTSGSRWTWLAFWLIVWIPVVKELAVDGRFCAAQRSGRNELVYDRVMPTALGLLTLYPIVWALSVGSSTITREAGLAAFAVLDLLVKAGIGFWVVALRDEMDVPARLAGPQQPVFLPRDSDEGLTGRAGPVGSGTGVGGSSGVLGPGGGYGGGGSGGFGAVGGGR